MDHLKKRIVAVHQPNYLPWSGFFYKLYVCDAFVFLDHVKLNKQGFTRRTNIADHEHDSGKVLLTIPLVRHSDDTKINELIIDHTRDWAHNHLQRIYKYYVRFPHFKETFTLLENIFKRSGDFHKLSDWNIHLIQNLSAHMDIVRPFSISSDLVLHEHKNEMNAEIVKLSGGTHYFCGEGAKDSYFNKKVFEDLNIQLLYSDYLHHLEVKPYRSDPVACKTSILDLLFWLGAEGARQYFSQIG